MGIGRGHCDARQSGRRTGRDRRWTDKATDLSRRHWHTATTPSHQPFSAAAIFTPLSLSPTPAHARPANASLPLPSPLDLRVHDALARPLPRWPSVRRLHLASLSSPLIGSPPRVRPSDDLLSSRRVFAAVRAASRALPPLLPFSRRSHLAPRIISRRIHPSPRLRSRDAVLSSHDDRAVAALALRLPTSRSPDGLLSCRATRGTLPPPMRHATGAQPAMSTFAHARRFQRSDLLTVWSRRCREMVG